MAHRSPLLGFLPLLLLFLLASCGRDGPGEVSTVEVRVDRVALDEETGSPVVVLAEVDGERHLPIWIGYAEATSIASRLQDVKAPRPNTHDLATRLINGLEGELQRVVVTDLTNGVYFARILLERGGRIVEIDSRPSDAIAIALRAGAPVFVHEPLFDAVSEASTDAGEHI
jgi:bifunctional DNase/RNase